MLLVITTPKSCDSYVRVASRLATAFESMAILNTIVCDTDWYTPTCLVLEFSSLYLTEDVIETRLHAIFKSLYFSLPSGEVSDLKCNPYLLYRFLDINVSLKSTI